jgi:hypothetical protein
MTKTSEQDLRTLAHLIVRPTQVDVDALDPAAISKAARLQGLAPMLAWTLRERGIDLSAPAWLPLAREARIAAMRFLLHHSAYRRVQAVLEGAGIPVVALKGFALACTVYPAPACRSMGDLDVLVPYARRDDARRLAEGLGYHEAHPVVFQGLHEMSHHYHLRGHLRNAVALEIHYHLLGACDKVLTLEQLEWFWRHTRQCCANDLLFTTLEPAAHLLYLCAHAMLQHGEARSSLRSFLDLHFLITRSPDLDWAAVLDQAVTVGWTYAVGRALAFASDYYDTPLPEGFLSALEQRRPKCESIVHVLRGERADNRWQACWNNLSRMSWRPGLRLAFGAILPDTAYMRWRYRTDSDWKLPFAYARRWLRALVGFSQLAAGRIRERVRRRRRQARRQGADQAGT